MDEQYEVLVIDRLRTALGHGKAGVSASGPVMAVSRRVGLGRAWLLAIASAASLVVVAVGGITVLRSGNEESVATPDTLPATVVIRSQSAAPDGSPWYVLASPDLVPGQVQVERCCSTVSSDGAPMTMVWARLTGPAAGMFSLTEVLDGIADRAPPAIDPDATTRRIDGRMLVFNSYGLSDAERVGLAQQVVPGSGLPYVLPADGWQYLAMGHQGAGALSTQDYTNSQGVVSLSVGDYRGQLAELAATDGAITEVTIAGNLGWMATDGSGTVIVWPAADSGRWALMKVPLAMADRLDGLIAAVGEVNEDSAAIRIPPPISPPST